MGLLRGRRHTSNGLEYLRSHVSGYAEADNYVHAPAVRDRKLITASGLADVEFARELFEELDVLSAEERASWAEIFRSARLPDEPLYSPLRVFPTAPHRRTRTPISRSMTVTPLSRPGPRPGLSIRRPCISTLDATRPITQLPPTTT